MPGPDSAGPEDRLIGPDHRIISRLARGQSFVLLIKREQSDAIAKAGGRLGPESKGQAPRAKARQRPEAPDEARL